MQQFKRYSVIQKVYFFFHLLGIDHNIVMLICMSSVGDVGD